MVLFFQIGGFYGGSIGALLAYWESAGFFSYVLPFLLIFALVFGILTRTDIFQNNKGLNAVIAIAVGLLALQFDFVPLFFSELFPRFGMGLSVILVALILIGLFLPSGNNKYSNWVLLIISVIVFLFVIGKSFGTFYWWSSVFNWYYWSPEVIAIILILVAIIAVVAGTSPTKKFKVPDWPYPPIWQAARAEGPMG